MSGFQKFTNSIIYILFQLLYNVLTVDLCIHKCRVKGALLNLKTLLNIWPCKLFHFQGWKNIFLSGNSAISTKYLPIFLLYVLFLSESSLPFIFILRPQNFTSKVESFCGLRKFQDLDAFFEVPGQITSKFSGN